MLKPRCWERIQCHTKNIHCVVMSAVFWNPPHSFQMRQTVSFLAFSSERVRYESFPLKLLHVNLCSLSFDTIVWMFFAPSLTHTVWLCMALSKGKSTANYKAAHEVMPFQNTIGFMNNYILRSRAGTKGRVVGMFFKFSEKIILSLNSAYLPSVLRKWNVFELEMKIKSPEKDKLEVWVKSEL